jgi:hypothetical protein
MKTHHVISILILNQPALMIILHANLHVFQCRSERYAAISWIEKYFEQS